MVRASPATHEGAMFTTLLATGLLLAAAPLEPARAFPAYLLVRGGTLAKPVLIHNTPPRAVRIRGFIEYVPVATLVGMQRDLLPQPTSPGELVYEVAEYWGMVGTPVGGADALRWDGATQYSRLHVMANGDVVWEALDGPYRGNRPRFQRLEQPAIEVLADFGIPLPPSVPRFDAVAQAGALAGCWTMRQQGRLGGGEARPGLPLRLMVEATPIDADGARSLVAFADSAPGAALLRGSWRFSRADMIAAAIPGAGGMRTAHLSFGMIPGALRGMVELVDSTPQDVSGDWIELVRATCR